MAGYFLKGHCYFFFETFLVLQIDRGETNDNVPKYRPTQRFLVLPIVDLRASDTRPVYKNSFLLNLHDHIVHDRHRKLLSLGHKASLSSRDTQKCKRQRHTFWINEKRKIRGCDTHPKKTHLYIKLVCSKKKT